jgi:hypothetical protein
MAMDKTQFMEHRWGNRFEVDVPAELWTADGMAASGTVRAASLSGALVETELKPPVLSRVSLKPRADASGWLEACVVRVDERAIAVEWLDPGRQSFSAVCYTRSDRETKR